MLEKIFIKFDNIHLLGNVWAKFFAILFNLVAIPAQVFGWVYLVALAVNVAWG